MNEHLRAQSQTRLAEIETRLLEIQNHLEGQREREALEVICELRGQLSVLFAALLVGHLQATLAGNTSPEVTQSQMQEFKMLFDQLLN